MMMHYTKDMFKDDKKEMLQWIDENWQYGDIYFTHFGNILNQLRQMFEEILRSQERSK